MLKKYNHLLNFFHQAIDFLVVVCVGAILFRFDAHLDVLMGALILILIFKVMQFYHSFREKGLWEMIMSIFVAMALWMIGLKIFFWFIHANLAAHIIDLWIGIIALYFILKQMLLILLARFFRAKGYNMKHIVLIGEPDLTQRVLEELSQHPKLGYHVVKVSKDPAQLNALLHEENPDQIWIAYPLENLAQVKAIVAILEDTPIEVRLITDISDLGLINQSVSQIGILPIINIRSTPMSDPAVRLIKALEDRIIAGIILFCVSPIMLIIAALVKLSSPGPVFYRQERVSINGNSFMMLKFRSMPVNAEKNSGAVWAKAGEKRATKIGSFLRRTSLDELPQFMNVLKGNMSIVGPRPERPELIAKFKQEIPLYMQKHLVKAGITGWAQVNGWRGNTDLHKRIEYDLYYIQNWSLRFDLKIIFLTVLKGFLHKNAY